MYLSDYHTHCSLSFDSKTPVEDMVRAGIAQGLQEMCLTDHVDLFRPRETVHWEHDFSNREETFARADQAADGKIIVRRGIELGEAMRALTTTEDTPSATSFETYLRGELGTYSDQTFERYEAMIGERAAASPQRNITEETLLHTVQLGGFDTLEEAEASQA